MIWRDIAHRLAVLLRRFREESSQDLRRNAYEMFWTKTIDRIEELRRQGFTLANASTICLNGRLLRGWSSLADDVEQRLAAPTMSSIPAVMHGDLCFSNILCDVDTGLIKLVDPRGRFGDLVGTMGDQQYDLAKMRHSYHGLYDFVMARLYRLRKLSENTYELTIQSRNSHQRVSELLDEELMEREGVTLSDIELIEGLLFVSMCPLHYDDVQRQTALWLRGLEILNSALRT